MYTTEELSASLEKAQESLQRFIVSYLKVLTEQVRLYSSSASAANNPIRLEERSISSLTMLGMIDLNYDSLLRLFENDEYNLFTNSPLSQEMFHSIKKLKGVINLSSVFSKRNKDRILFLMDGLCKRHADHYIEVVILNKELPPPWRPGKFN